MKNKLKTKVDIDQLKIDIETLKNTTSLEEAKSIKEKYNLALNEMAAAQSKSSSKTTKTTSYTYPFLMYFGHEYRDVSHIFENGKSYSTKEITDALINHGYKEFKYANTVEYEYFADENCLFPKLTVGNRG